MSKRKASAIESMEITPIKPEDVPDVYSEPDIPDFVIDLVNGLIRKKYDISSKSATILVKEIVKEILSHQTFIKMNLERKDIFKNRWLDFEKLYRAENWTVIYDSPAYCETYDPYFVFTKPKA